MRARAITLLCGLSLLWGSSWIFGPELASVAAPFAALALSMACAAVLLGVAAAVLRLVGPRQAHVAGDGSTSLVLGAVMLWLPAVLLLVAGVHGVGGWPLLVYALLPLLTAFVGDKWSTSMVLAPGAVFVLIDGTLSFEPARLVWATLALAAVALQAFGLRFAARTVRGWSVARRLQSMAVQALCSAFVLALCSLVFDAHPRIAPLGQWQSQAVLSLLYLSVAATAVPYLLMYRLLAEGVLRPEQVAAGQWLQTLFAVAESAYLAKAHVSWLLWIAAGVLLGCLVRVLGPDIPDGPTTIAT